MTPATTQLAMDLNPLDAAVAELVARFSYRAVQIELDMHRPAVASAPARPTDPETSHRAAKQMTDVGRFSDRSRQAKLLRAFSVHPLTDQQATIRVVGGAAPPSAFDGCRRRCSDLRAAGYLRDSGMRRHNVGSDDESVVWTITDLGERAIARLDETNWSR